MSRIAPCINGGRPLNEHGDRGAALRRASVRHKEPLLYGVVAGATLALAALGGCGGGHEPAPAASNDASRRADVVVRTSRFAITPTPTWISTQRQRVAFVAEPGGRMRELFRPRRNARRQARCLLGTTPAPRAPLVGTPLTNSTRFFHDTWAAHEIDTRRTLGRSGTPLMNSEDVLAPTLARQMASCGERSDRGVRRACEKAVRRGRRARRRGSRRRRGMPRRQRAARSVCSLARSRCSLPTASSGRALEEARGRLEGAPIVHECGPSWPAWPSSPRTPQSPRSSSVTRRREPSSRDAPSASARGFADDGRDECHGEESPQYLPREFVAEAVRAAW